MKKVLSFLKKKLKRLLNYIRERRALGVVRSHKGEIFIGGPTSLTANTVLGYNPNFNGMDISGNGNVIIGDNFHSGKECIIITQNHNYEGSEIPYDNTFLLKDVIIGDNVWFGDRVIVLGGVEIGEGAIIQAGAVVVKSIPPCAIAGGNPATVFKYRDKEHYFSLKEQKKFH